MRGRVTNQQGVINQRVESSYEKQTKDFLDGTTPGEDRDGGKRRRRDICCSGDRAICRTDMRRDRRSIEGIKEPPRATRLRVWIVQVPVLSPAVGQRF